MTRDQAATPAVERGMPDREALLALLQSAYGDWGDADLLRWAYDEYPGFAPEHAFSVTVDDELAAFRRAYHTAVENEGDPVPVAVLGDTCVARAHRGEGLYSALHGETVAAVREAGAACAATFNRAGGVTHAANRDRGWAERTLPLHLRVFAPERVLPHLVDAALDGGVLAGTPASVLGSIAGAFGDRLPARVAVPIVEVAGARDRLPAARRRLAGAWQRYRDGDPDHDAPPAPGDEPLPPGAVPVPPGDVTVRESPLDDPGALADELGPLYRAAAERVDHRFRRDEATREHLLAHPWLAGVVVAEGEGVLRGVAPVSVEPEPAASGPSDDPAASDPSGEPDRASAPREARVLDLVVRDEPARTAVLDEATRLAREAGADLLSVLTPRSPGPRWLAVDRQVLMWTPFDADDAPAADDPPAMPTLDEGSLHIGFYDVV